MILPNFLVIGSSRSGTTSLYHHLDAHPQVYVTPILEPRFFAFEGDVLDYHGPGDCLLKERVTTKLDDYSALFDGVTGEIAIGEVSPAYLSIPSTAQRIHRYVPGARLIAILRNPVERAISSFRLEVLHGFEPLTDFATALAQEESRIQNNWSYVWQYSRRGQYYTQLKLYYDLFPAEQIKIYLYEDLKRNAIGLIKDVFRFIGVDDEAISIDVSVRHNSTDSSRFSARGLLQPSFSPELQKRLIDEYRDEIDRLQELINRDLSGWLT
jgi:hypothetical protein